MSPKIQFTHPMGTDGIVRCKHGEQVDRLVSRTDKNPGREFYVCSRPKAEQCGFWVWTDDPIFRKPPAHPVAARASTSSQSVPSNGLHTPQPSPFHSTSTSTLQSTPAKRKRSEGSTIDPCTSRTPTSKFASTDTPGKRARLEAIEAGLRARHEAESPHQPPRLPPAVPEQPDALPFTHGVASAPSPASDTNTDVGEAEPPRGWISFLGLPPSQESESGAGPSTPKKRPSSIVDGEDPFSHHGETSSSVLLTPPQSAKQHASQSEAFAPTASGGEGSRPEPVTPTRHKGKERADPRWDQFIQGEENPFVDTTSSSRSKLKLDGSRASHPPRSWSGSQDPSCTPTTGECITTDIRKIFDAIDTFRARSERLGQPDPLNYIERLERQKNALEVSNEAKKKRIAELEGHIAALEGQVRQKDTYRMAKH